MQFETLFPFEQLCTQFLQTWRQTPHTWKNNLHKGRQEQPKNFILVTTHNVVSLTHFTPPCNIVYILPMCLYMVPVKLLHFGRNSFCNAPVQEISEWCQSAQALPFPFNSFFLSFWQTEVWEETVWKIWMVAIKAFREQLLNATWTVDEYRPFKVSSFWW